MGSSQSSSVQNYRPGVDRPAKTYEEVYEEMQQENEQKSSGIKNKVTGSLRVASRLGRTFATTSMLNDDNKSNEGTQQTTQSSGIYVPNNLMEVRQNVDYMRQNGQKVKTLGYTDAQIGTMSDLDKQKVISSGFANNPNGANVQSFLAKSAAYNITEKIMPQASVVAPVIKKVKQLAPKKASTYIEDDFSATRDSIDYGLVSNDVDYLKSSSGNAYHVDAPTPDTVPQPEATTPQSGGMDRNAALDELTANIKPREMETELTYGGSYF